MSYNFTNKEVQDAMSKCITSNDNINIVVSEREIESFQQLIKSSVSTSRSLNQLVFDFLLSYGFSTYAIAKQIVVKIEESFPTNTKIKIKFEQEIEYEREHVLWYSGHVATITVNGLTCKLSAKGDIVGTYRNITIKDTNQMNNFYTIMQEYITTDITLLDTIKYNKLVLDSRNWWEIDILNIYHDRIVDSIMLDDADDEHFTTNVIEAICMLNQSKHNLSHLPDNIKTTARDLSTADQRSKFEQARQHLEYIVQTQYNADITYLYGLRNNIDEVNIWFNDNNLPLVALPNGGALDICVKDEPKPILICTIVLE